jgi:ankyrin repeat protein
VTDRLVQQALKIGLPDAVQENGEVLGVLNWISRGLKSGLLTSSDNVNQLFQKSLPLIESWTGGDQCRQLLTDHNLGRCAVQINTLINHIKLDWQAKVSVGHGRIETYGELLQRCILNLCSESVLKRLTSAPIDTVSLLNVCNLVKDALSTRRLSPANKSLLPALACLVGAIGRIPHKELIGSYSDCRSVSNFSNFIRTLCEYRNGKDLVFDQALPTLTATCEHLISYVNDDLFVRSHPSQQALTNLISFIKLCDKRLNSPVPNANAPSSTSSSDSRLASTADRGPIAVSREKYVSAAQRLVNRLIEQSHDDQASSNAIGGLLAGLSYLWQRNLVPRSPALKSYVTSLLGHAATLPSSAWQDKSRAVLLPALLGMFNSGLASEAATQPLLERLQVTGDLRTAMKALNMVEEVIEPLPVQPITVDTPIPIPEAKSERRAIPGMTTLREVPTLGMFSNSSSTTAYSTTASPIHPAAKQNPVTPDWQDAKHVTRPPATSAVLPHTAPVLIPNMTGNKKASQPKEQVDVNKVAQQKKVQPSSSSKTNKQNARSAKATDKTGSTKSTKSTQITGGKPAQTAEAAILAGDSARVDLLLQQSEPWTAERIARTVDAVQTGTLMYEKPIYDALERFLDAVLKDIDSDERDVLKEHFLDNPPQIQFIATQLEEHSLIRTAHADNMIFTDSNDDIRPNVEAIVEAIDKIKSAQAASPQVSQSIDRGGVKKYLIRAAPPQVSQSIEKGGMNKNERGMNNLITAVLNNRTKLVDKILKNRANAEKQSTKVEDNGWNALMVAAVLSKEETVQRLLKLRSTADKQTTSINKDGCNALMLAAQSGINNIVQLLLQHQATADQQTTSINKYGLNALMLAAQSRRKNTIQLLLKHQATADKQTTDVNEDGWNALMIAVELGSNNIIQLLLQHQATADKQTTNISKDGNNALMIAAENGYDHVVELLLKHQSTVDQQTTTVNKDGWNALMIAAQRGHNNVTQLLLQHQATADQQTTNVDKNA